MENRLSRSLRDVDELRASNGTSDGEYGRACAFAARLWMRERE